MTDYHSIAATITRKLRKGTTCNTLGTNLKKLVLSKGSHGHRMLTSCALATPATVKAILEWGNCHTNVR
jgi:hypothetical protein